MWENYWPRHTVATSIHNFHDLCSKTNKLPNGSCFAVSENGWIDQELFFIFLQSTLSTMLYRTAQFSFCWMDIVLISSPKHLKDHGIIIFCLPPHTTHVCQPLIMKKVMSCLMLTMRSGLKWSCQQTSMFWFTRAFCTTYFDSSSTYEHKRHFSGVC